VDPVTRADGWHYLEVWNLPRAPIPGRPQSFAFDRASFNRWRLWLVTSGKVLAPFPEILAEATLSHERRIARVEILPIPDDARKARLKDVQGTAKMWKDAVVPERAR
jgi:hypothetical protein